jgi:cytidylate kinase
MKQISTRLAPGLERLVERQIRNWELSRSQHTRDPAKKKSVQEFVAISRQAGSLGSEIARQLAEKLGWPIFDKEILHAMSGEDSFRQRLYESMDERDVGWVESLLAPLVRGEFATHEYFPVLTRTILMLARGSAAVFVGRAADLVLPRNHGLRIRIVAPIESRVVRLAEQRKIPMETARHEVHRIDRERAEFIRHHFHLEIDDPTRCDLTINTGGITAGDAVELILCQLRRRGVAIKATNQAVPAL